MSAKINEVEKGRERGANNNAEERFLHVFINSIHSFRDQRKGDGSRKEK